MTPLKRQRSLPPDKREKLFEAGREEFAAHGYEQASYNRIIKACGISKGSVYYHYADKSDLFVEIQRDAFARIGEQLGPWPKAKDAEEFWTGLREIMQRFDLIAMQDPDLAALGRALYAGGDRSKTMVALRADAEEWVAGILRKGQQLEAVRTDIPLPFLTRALTSMVIGLDHWFVENWETMDEEQLKRLSDATHQLIHDLAKAILLSR